MELCELLCTVSVNQINELTFEGQDIKGLLEFMAENNVSYSTIDEFDNSLSDFINSLIEQADDGMMLEYNESDEIIEELKEIESEYKNIFNSEVFVQSFKIANDNQINLALS